MLENLLNLVKEQAGDAIINNSAIPNEDNEAAIETASGSIFESLKGIAGSGNLSGIISMFSGGGGLSNNPLVSGITSNVAGDLMRKFGLGNGVASGIAQSLIPTVMERLVSKTNNPDDSSFDLQGILGSLTGGQQTGNQQENGLGGIMNSVKGLFGG